MKTIWESVRFFILSHRTASIIVAGAVGVTAVGAGGVGIYNLISDDNQVEEKEAVVEAAVAQDVDIPEFKNVKITSESLEKDLTIYISDENDNPVTGVTFEVKMLTPEAAESLQSYVDSIQALDDQIEEYTLGYETSQESSTDTSADVASDGSTSTDVAETSTNAAGLEAIRKQQAKESGQANADAKAQEEAAESEETTDDSSEEGQEDKTGVDASTLASDTESIKKALRDRNVAVTITDENGQVIETQTSDMTTDPLYQLCLDKETAVEAYTQALKDVEGTVYTDDDQDGVITQTDLEPGDYVLCLVNDTASGVSYEPMTYVTEATVAKEVEYKVQKEITKQIKKDDSAEDGQQKEVVPVEETLKDTVEYVESKKVENGSKANSTTDVVAPTNTASSSKATVKSGGKTSVSKEIVKTTKRIIRTNGAIAARFFDPSKIILSATTTDETTSEETTTTIYKITVSFLDESGNSIKASQTDEYESGKEYTYSAPTIDGYTLTSDSTVSGTASADATIKFTYKKNEEKTEEKTEETKTEYTITVECLDASNTVIKTSTVTTTNGGTYSITAPSIDGYTLTSSSSTASGTATADKKVQFTYKKNETKTTETATLDMSYSAGTFTISATTNVGSVTVNGTAVTMKDGKGTFKATKNGDYTLKGTVTWSDKTTDTSLTVTYTVSGYGTDSSEQLKDKAGNLLFLDEALTKPATAADYKAGTTYYYKQATYTYYGWQTIDGQTYYYDKNANLVTGDQVIQGVKYSFGTDGALMVKGTGIDVSKYQGKIDWAQAKSAVSFAIIRCGYRGMYDGQLHEDPYFYTNMKNAKANGVSTGVYIYSTALNEAEAVQEASMAVAMAQKAGGCSYPIYLDMEDTVRGQSSLSVDQRMAIVNAFVSTVQSSGYKAGIYCSKNWMTQRMNSGAIPSSCSVWIAQYNTSCTYSGRKNIWQYSSKGSVPGIKGNVDMNQSF